MADATLKAALVVVDFQEDFCPPNGSLAVREGRDIATAVNDLLELPFALKIATKDWHPIDHISFAPNHPPPNNKPFTSTVTIENPFNPSEVQTTLLWPIHCVQGSKGAELVPELHATKLDHIIGKGQDRRVEMYSAFADPFLNPPVSRSNLESLLKESGITHVFCVGLALDYCVKFTALHAAEAGFTTFVVNEGTKAVDPCTSPVVEKELLEGGVQMVSINSAEVGQLRSLLL